MQEFRILWDAEDNPEGNVQHVAQHGLTIQDIECVLQNPEREATSHSTGRPCCFGYTPGGEYVICVYEWVDEETIYPVTAYEVPEP